MISRPKLRDVLSITDEWEDGTTVTLSVSHTDVCVTNDGGFIGPRVTFILGRDRRKSIRKGIDALEEVLNQNKLEKIKEKENED